MSYFKEIIFTAVVCGILTKLPPTSKGGTGKLVKYAASLIFIIALITPLIGKADFSENLFNDLSGIALSEKGENVQTGGSKTQIQILTEEICKAVSENTAENFEISADSFSYKIKYRKDVEGLSINSATVHVKKTSANISEGQLANHFEKLLGCPTEVIFDEKNHIIGK